MESPCLVFASSSGKAFYFRSKMPSDLREHFGGLKEFRVSLKCNIKSKATKVVRSLNKTVSRLYEQIRLGMKELSIEDIKEILRTEIRKQILLVYNVCMHLCRPNESNKFQYAILCVQWLRNQFNW